MNRRVAIISWTTDGKIILACSECGPLGVSCDRTDLKIDVKNHLDTHKCTDQEFK